MRYYAHIIKLFWCEVSQLIVLCRVHPLGWVLLVSHFVLVSLKVLIWLHFSFNNLLNPPPKIPTNPPRKVPTNPLLRFFFFFLNAKNRALKK